MTLGSKPSAREFLFWYSIGPALQRREGLLARAGFEEIFVGDHHVEEAFVGKREAGVGVLLELFVGGHVDGGGDAGIDVEAGLVGVSCEPFVFADEAHGGGGILEILAEGVEEALLIEGEYGIGAEELLRHALGAGAIFEGDGFEDVLDILFEFVRVELEGGFEVEFFRFRCSPPGGEEGGGTGLDGEPAELGIDVGAPGGLPFLDPGGFANEFEHDGTTKTRKR